MTEPCGAEHPEVAGVTCTKKDDRCFEKHSALHFPDGIEAVPLTWDNPRQRPPKKGREGKTEAMAGATKGTGTAGPPGAVWKKDDGGLAVALTRVDAAADDNFKDEAKAMLKVVAGRQEFLTSEDILDCLSTETHDNRAMGPIMLWGKSQGFISKTDPEKFEQSRYARNHKMDVRVWRSLIHS